MKNIYDDDYDNMCYECKGYGDDYYFDENGDLIYYCAECPFNGYNIDYYWWRSLSPDYCLKKGNKDDKR